MFEQWKAVIAAKAGNYVRVAKMYEQAGDTKNAAELYLRAGDTEHAAKLYEQAGDAEHAAVMYEYAGDYAHAMKMYKQAGNFPPIAITVGIQNRQWQQAFEAIEQAKQSILGGEYSISRLLLLRAQTYFGRAQGADVRLGLQDVEQIIAKYQDAPVLQELLDVAA